MYLLPSTLYKYGRRPLTPCCLCSLDPSHTQNIPFRGLFFLLPTNPTPPTSSIAIMGAVLSSFSKLGAKSTRPLPTKPQGTLLGSNENKGPSAALQDQRERNKRNIRDDWEEFIRSGSLNNLVLDKHAAFSVSKGVWEMFLFLMVECSRTGCLS